MTHNRYHANDRMSDLIQGDYRLLQVMSRFGIALGFGDRTVGEVCVAAGVDTGTFLAVAQFLQEEDELVHDNVDTLSLTALLDYLKRAHSYYLDFSLPAIRQKLVRVIDTTQGGEIGMLILKFFDEYAGEVREHMEFEDRYEFAYVRSLMQGDVAQAEAIACQVCPPKASSPCRLEVSPNAYQAGERSNILLFTRRHAMQHKLIDSKLAELKNIIIKYYPASGDNPLLGAVLFDIFICEEDLALHCRIEDCLFVPAVRLLEKSVEYEK